MPHLRGHHNQPTQEILLRRLPLRPLRQRRVHLKWSIPDLTVQELAWHLFFHSLVSVSQLLKIQSNFDSFIKRLIFI